MEANRLTNKDVKVNSPRMYGEAVVVDYRKERHQGAKGKLNYNTFNGVTENGESVTVFELEEGENINIKLVNVVGNGVLNSKGYILSCANTQKALVVKEKYSCNLAELKQYLEGGVPNEADMSETEILALSGFLASEEEEKFRRLGVQLTNDITEGWLTFERAGFYISDFQAERIAVQVIPTGDSCSFQFRLIVVDDKVTGSDSTVNQVDDLLNYFLPNEDQTSSLLDADFWTMFRKNPKTSLNHPSLWTRKKQMQFFGELNVIIQNVSVGSMLTNQDQIMTAFVESMNQIPLDLNNLNEDSWRNIIGRKSVGVWGLTFSTDFETEFGDFTPQECKQPIYLIRFIRNEYEHIVKIEPESKVDLGKSTESYCEFFENAFPHLLLEAHRVFNNQYDNLRKAWKDNPHIRSAAEYITPFPKA